jgi:hypothetical protein
LIEKLSSPLCEYILAEKYKNPSDEENYAQGRIYVKKLGTNIYKLIYYTFVTIAGFLILRQVNYFPTLLFGNGDLYNMYAPGYPGAFYHWKPYLFDLYFLGGLAFCITDLIWLLFVYELQSDFILMLLHHLCTISLISFSFLTNWSNIGSIILILHDFCDIIVYISRIIVNMDVKKSTVIFTGICLLSSFIYLRLFVFGKVIASLWFGVTWKWDWATTCLFTFLGFLYIMHVNWVYLIIQKFSNALFKNKYEDTAKIKKFDNKQK